MKPASSAKRLQNHIGGSWLPAQPAEWRAVRNPATGEHLAEVPMCGAAEVDAAVAAAAEAFREWRQVPAMTRARYLFDLKQLMERDFEQLARTVVEEHGKTIDEARGEVRRGIENIEFAAGAPSLLTGYSLPDVAAGIDEYTVREPLGVCAVIPPYNFPVMVPLWFIPLAIACGNTVVLKPSEQVPQSSDHLVRLIEEAGVPAGVVNLVHGGKAAVERLTEHPQVRAVSFVGSSAVAKLVYTRSTAAGKRAQCQGGAKNAVVVMPDAELRRTVPSLITSCYGCAGQRCLAGSLIVAVGGNGDALVEAFVAAARKLTLGDGRDERVQMGPVISRAHRDRVVAWIDRAVADGATAALDGRGVQVPGLPDDCFVGPTVLDRVRPDMAIAREEVFGPVVAIARAKDLDEAIAIIDAIPYGNAAAIYTRDGGAARAFRSRVACGNIGINVGVPAPIAFFPFGGMKGSFYGDLHGQGRDGVEFFTDRKVVIERW